MGSLTARDTILDAGLDLLAWTAAVAVVGFAAVQTPAGPQLAIDMPVLLAAGYLLGPIPSGLIAFAGYVDLREFRGEIGWERAIFNRAQTSLSVMAAASVFAFFTGESGLWPEAALGALAAVGVDCLVNFGLVAGVMAINDRLRPRTSLSRLSLGPLLQFGLTYAAYGFVSLLLAEIYVSVGVWGVVLFATPLVLAHQALSTAQKLDGATQRLRVQGTALHEATDRVAEERRDERIAVAAGLHDDVLPPLVRVHLLGQVLRHELATGQLLALEDDLPALLQATDDASEAIRNQIRSLRTSTVGISGLARSLESLVRQLDFESPCACSAELDDVRGAPVVELLAYQIARECLRNAVRHAEASTVRLSLLGDGESLTVAVQDDGRGFVPALVDDNRHFGLALMRERVALAGGMLDIESAPGAGTRVIARLPKAIAKHQ
ncbi:MAG: sensor histidine kinase [Actinomycetota bacterium]